MSYEWVTTLVIKHEAGSQEGAIFHRNEMEVAIRQLGGEVTMADSRPGDAAGAGLTAFFAVVDEDDDE